MNTTRIMELKNLEPKTINDFTIALLLDSCVEITPMDNNSVEDITVGEIAND